MTETILVTGGAGYSGSHCCKLLATAGYLPGVYDDLSNWPACSAKLSDRRAPMQRRKSIHATPLWRLELPVASPNFG